MMMMMMKTVYLFTGLLATPRLSGVHIILAKHVTEHCWNATSAVARK